MFEREGARRGESGVYPPNISVICETAFVLPSMLLIGGKFKTYGCPNTRTFLSRCLTRLFSSSSFIPFFSILFLV